MGYIESRRYTIYAGKLLLILFAVMIISILLNLNFIYGMATLVFLVYLFLYPFYLVSYLVARRTNNVITNPKEKGLINDQFLKLRTFPRKLSLFNFWGIASFSYDDGSIFFNKCPNCEKGAIIKITEKGFMSETEKLVCENCGISVSGPYTKTMFGRTYRVTFTEESKMKYNNLLLTRHELEEIANGGESFIENAKLNNKLPDLTEHAFDLPIILRKDEVIHWFSNASYLEERAVRRSRTRGTSVRVMKGAYLRSSETLSSYAYSEWRIITTGTLILTNERLLFIGQTQSVEHELKKIRVLNKMNNGILINSSRYKRNHLFKHINSDEWIVFIKTAIRITEFQKCPVCGKIIEDENANFCYYCGTKITRNKISRKRK